MRSPNPEVYIGEDKEKMTREEIYGAWTKLSHDVRKLGDVVIGPMDNITSDNLAEWADSFEQVREALATAADETAKFLAWAAARKRRTP